MDTNDEAELFRLAEILSQIEAKNELTADEKEAFKKATLALTVSFIHGHRKELEDIYNDLAEQLSAEQKEYLKSLGLKNE